MALVNCPECGKEISDTASKCIHCGLPIKKCLECGIVVPSDTVICPNCGIELKNSNIKASENKPRKSISLEKKKKIIKSVVGIAISCAVLITIIILSIFIVKPYFEKNKIYKEASSLIDQKEFDKAKELYNSLGNFKKSKTMVFESDYLKASNYLEQNNFSVAKNIFESLGDYSDSSDMVKETQFRLGKSYLEKNQFASAYDVFSSLGDYSNSQEMANQTKYKEAEDFVTNEKYDEAIEIMEALGDYSDCIDKTAEYKKKKEEYEASLITVLVKVTEYDSDKADKKTRYEQYYENEILTKSLSYSFSDGKLNATTFYEYDANGKLKQEKIEYAYKDSKRIVKYTYQGNLQVKEEFIEDGKTFMWIEYQYDDKGRKTRSSFFYSDKPDKSESWVNYYYDDDSDKVSRDESVSEYFGGVTTVTEFTYNSDGTINKEITRDYTSYTNPINGEYEDHGGQITSELTHKYEYNKEGLITSETTIKGDGEVYRYKEYTYESVKK